MELWEAKFVGMFLFKKPVCQYAKEYKFLKCASIKYCFESFSKEDVWMSSIVKLVQLTAKDTCGNETLVGESFMDGSGWFMYQAYPRGRGVYQKFSQMYRLVKEYTNVIGYTKTNDWSADNVVHFRLKPQNIRFLSTTKGFNDFVTAKYATAGFVA